MGKHTDRPCVGGPTAGINHHSHEWAIWASSPVKPSDNSSRSLHRPTTVWETPNKKHPADLSQSTRQREMINWCFKALHVGVAYNVATDKGNVFKYVLRSGVTMLVSKDSEVLDWVSWKAWFSVQSLYIHSSILDIMRNISLEGTVADAKGHSKVDWD